MKRGEYLQEENRVSGVPEYLLLMVDLALQKWGLPDRLCAKWRTGATIAIATRTRFQLTSNGAIEGKWKRKVEHNVPDNDWGDLLL